MTAPTELDLGTLVPQPIPEGVPDHRASGESGDPSPSLDTPKRGRPRNSLFGRGDSGGATRARGPVRQSVPKLPASAKGQIERMYLLLGGFVRPFDELIGDTIIEQAPICAESVFELAQTNEKFRAALAGLMTSSLSMAVLMAHLPIIFAVTRKSSNPKVKATSIGGYMALKMTDKIEMPNLWAEMPDTEPVDKDA